MKFRLIALALLVSAPALATDRLSFELKGDSARNVVAALLSARQKEKATSQPKVYSFGLQDVFCKESSHGFIGGEDMGIGYLVGCWNHYDYNSEKDTGIPMVNTDRLTDILQKEAEARGGTFWDGAAGKVIADLKSLTCTANVADGVDPEQAYACKIELGRASD